MQSGGKSRTQTVTTDIDILHIYSSPGHHYFTREKFDVGDAETLELERIALQPDRGIRGDRFEFSKYPLTFISHEVILEVCNALGLAYRPSLFRRNIVISGINLNQLIGRRFVIGEVEYEGIEHCAPCTWMNAVMKKGAYKLMIGRGGLRARVIKGGSLEIGTNTLITDYEYEPIDSLKAMEKPRIPR